MTKSSAMFVAGPPVVARLGQSLDKQELGGWQIQTKAGGVDHVQRHAFDLDGFAQAVTRGAGDRRDDGQLGTGQRVEQRALARVRRAHDRHRGRVQQATQAA